MTLTILTLGILFGAILQYARLNKFDTISGMATMENLAVAKAIAIAIGVGAILMNIEIALGFASFHVKPIMLGGLIFGGLIFGIGMAILGYCPGTMAVSLGEGSLDALAGIIGGLAGGLVFTVIQPSVQAILGPDLGTISLNSLIGTNMMFYVLLCIIGTGFVAVSFWLHRIDKNKDWKWIYSGIALALLNVAAVSKVLTNRPVGASTTYPYVADLLTGLTNNDYFNKIKTPGNWELIFLAGAFLAGLVISLIKKDFKFTLLHNNWIKYKGTSAMSRIAWAFTGGFILILGARMAGGCTSGHILSGGMQLGVSSLIFAIFVFAGLLITGNVFYKRKS